MKWLHQLLKGFSLTGALFVFQACYGTPHEYMYEDNGMAPMTFSVVSHQTGQPLEGIHVKASYGSSGTPTYLGTTGADGRCRVSIPYTRNVKGPILFFEDQEGHYAAKDTTLSDLQEREILIKMESSLIQ